MKLLVIAAHADDEVLLCGGTLHKLHCRGHVTEVVFCTRNEQSRRMGEDAVARQQRTEAEAAAAARHLGFSVHYLAFEDMTLAERSGELLQALIAVLRQAQPDVVITHTANDWHSDHRSLAVAVPEAVLQCGYDVAGAEAGRRPAAVLQGEVDLEGLASFPFLLVSALGAADVNARLEAAASYPSIVSDHAVSAIELQRLLETRSWLRGRTVGADAGEAFELSSLLPLDARGLSLLAEVMA